MIRTRTIILSVSIFALSLFGLGVFALYHIVGRMTPAEVLEHDATRSLIRDSLPTDRQALFDMLPHLLGLSEPRTYLLLFQNNTELRPTGGFIGSFAVVRVSRGSFELLSVQGTEQLAWRDLPETAEKSPKPIEAYLGLPYWYSRDANWSPDFASSVPDILRLYRQEQGPYVDDIDMVVGITTRVLEDVIADIGDVVVEGKTFTPENAVEVLQYDTSRDYASRGIPWEDRKRMIDLLAEAILSRIASDPIEFAPKLLGTLNRLAKEGHVMLYSIDQTVQEQFEGQGVAGRVLDTSGDYLLWVDANLAAHKTDAAIERALSYRIDLSDGEQSPLATASMAYRHTGTFDWRTTRYLTYARVFVPRGSVLERVYTTDNSGVETDVDLSTVDSGEELGKQWFGFYYRLEPKQTGALSFVYRIPSDVYRQPYQLLVQKQLGTEAVGLTLDIEFDTTIQTATPAEDPARWHDATYTVQTDLRESRVFSVGF